MYIYCTILPIYGSFFTCVLHVFLILITDILILDTNAATKTHAKSKQ